MTQPNHRARLGNRPRNRMRADWSNRAVGVGYEKVVHQRLCPCIGADANQETSNHRVNRNLLFPERRLKANLPGTQIGASDFPE